MGSKPGLERPESRWAVLECTAIFPAFLPFSPEPVMFHAARCASTGGFGRQQPYAGLRKVGKPRRGLRALRTK